MLTTVRHKGADLDITGPLSNTAAGRLEPFDALGGEHRKGTV